MTRRDGRGGVVRRVADGIVHRSACLVQHAVAAIAVASAGAGKHEHFAPVVVGKVD